MKVVLGGTFAQIHKGHMKLLDKAFEIGDYVYIGLTSDLYVRDHKILNIDPYEYRKSALKKVVEKYGKDYVIVPINDKYGASISSDFDVIVVSMETQKTAIEINKIRTDKNLKPLKIITVDYIMAEDLMPISSSRILKGEIDKNGTRLTTIKINVGSQNNIKIEATKKVFSSIFKNYDVTGIMVNSGTSAQPFNADTLKGAINRAKECIKDADYGIGIEAGLIWNDPLNCYFDVHYVAILDKYGNMTYGHSSGFAYPRGLVEMLKSEPDIYSVLEKYTNVKNIGKSAGMAGFLSRNIITRSDLLEQAITMAMIPRLSWVYYYH
ncbi:MAG: inosine/xanthosine triphosphatase [Thermoplasmata archaeon]